MHRPLISIGLDHHIVESIKAEVGHVIDYQYLPDIYSVNGVSYVQSQSGTHYIRPCGILYYCYFDSPGCQRRSLALSDTPTFPDVRQTIHHDDKVLSLIAARTADAGLGYGFPGDDVPRGFASEEIHVSIETPLVAKWGQWHCGDGKKICDGNIDVPEPSILEPFIKGESHRILIVGHSSWQIYYESDDWRKNVNSKITILNKPDYKLVERALRIKEHLRLGVVGIDFIVNDTGSYLLEVNAYPGLDQVPEAEAEFIKYAVSWVKSVRARDDNEKSK